MTTLHQRYLSALQNGLTRVFFIFPFTVFKLFLELKDERDNERDFRHDSRRRSP